MSKKRVFWWALVFTSAMCVSLQASKVYLTWNPSPDARVVGYDVFYGASGQDWVATNAGLDATFTTPELASNTIYYFQVCAVDSDGLTSTFANTVVLTVDPLPTFVDQSNTVVFTLSGVSVTPGTSLVVAPGATANFNANVVSIGGGPISCQWNFNGAPLNGMTASSLWVWNVSSANAGVYTLTAWNTNGTVTSAPMTLTVLPLLSGMFNGLFYRTNMNGYADIDMNSSGMLANFVVGAGGIYSGRLYLNGAGFPLVGKFDAYGNSHATISRAATGEGTLDLRLRLNSAWSAGQVSGSVSNMDLLAPWLASLTADSAAPTNGLPAETSFDVAPVADGNWWGRLLVVNLPGGVLMWIKQAGVSSLGSEGFTNTTWATLASQ